MRRRKYWEIKGWGDEGMGVDGMERRDGKGKR